VAAILSMSASRDMTIATCAQLGAARELRMTGRRFLNLEIEFEFHRRKIT
jgi:hypothetical protein